MKDYCNETYNTIPFQYHGSMIVVVKLWSVLAIYPCDVRVILPKHFQTYKIMGSSRASIEALGDFLCSILILVRHAKHSSEFLRGWIFFTLCS